MTNLLNNIFKLYMVFLDQLDDDDSNFTGLLDIILVDLIPNVWYNVNLIDFTAAPVIENNWKNNVIDYSLQASIFSAVYIVVNNDLPLEDVISGNNAT